MDKLKFAGSFLLLSIWGPYLLAIWVHVVRVPEWAMHPGFRRALMLSPDNEPTISRFCSGWAGLVWYYGARPEC